MGYGQAINPLTSLNLADSDFEASCSGMALLLKLSGLGGHLARGNVSFRNKSSDSWYLVAWVFCGCFGGCGKLWMDGFQR